MGKLLAGKIGIGADADFDLGLDGGDLAVDVLQALGVLTLQQGKADGLASVLGGRAVLDQGSPGDAQLPEVGDDVSVDGMGLQVEQREKR